VTPDVAEQVKKMGAVLDRRGPGGQYRIYFNYTKPPFDNLKLRQAFMHAINRKQIRDTLWPGELGDIATSPLPEGYFGHIAVPIPEYDPDLAKKLLAEAGYPNGLTIKNYFITKYSGYPKIMVLVQEQLKKVGVNVELQLVEHATYHANIRKNLNPFVLYGGTRLTDGDVWLQLFFHSSEAPNPVTGNKGTNFSHYKEIDGLLEEARQQRNPQKRAEMYHEAQRRIMRDAVCLPIVNIPNIWARNPKRVSTPFCSDKCEFGLHYGYNYPEMFTILD
jgi:peptide/nickel transport system substrate-binding protein